MPVTLITDYSSTVCIYWVKPNTHINTNYTLFAVVFPLT